MGSGTLFTHGPDNVDSLLATTKSVILQTKDYLNDAIFGSIPTLSWLQSKAQINKQGGASILVPLLYGKNGTFAAYSGDDTIDTSGQEGITLAQATWRNYGGTIKFAGDEVAQNSGEGKLHDLVKAKTLQAMMSARDALAIDLWASSQAAKKVHCLPILVDATSTVQDINSTTNSWWQAQVAASGSFAAQGLADMRDLRDDLARQGQSGNRPPDGVFTTQLVYELYEASQLSGLRYKPGDAVNASIDKLAWGPAEIQFDPNISTGQLYMLSSDALEFVVHRDANWAVGDFIEPASQDVRIAKVIWRGNLVVKNRRRLGKLTSITA